MTIIEILERIGIENVLIQPLNECVTHIQYRPKLKANQISFITNQMKCGDFVTDDPDAKEGLILWIPKRLLAQFNQTGKETCSHPPQE